MRLPSLLAAVLFSITSLALSAMADDTGQRFEIMARSPAVPLTDRQAMQIRGTGTMVCRISGVDSICSATISPDLVDIFKVHFSCGSDFCILPDGVPGGPIPVEASDRIKFVSN